MAQQPSWFDTFAKGAVKGLASGKGIEDAAKSGVGSVASRYAGNYLGEALKGTSLEGISGPASGLLGGAVNQLITSGKLDVGNLAKGYAINKGQQWIGNEIAKRFGGTAASTAGNAAGSTAGGAAGGLSGGIANMGAGILGSVLSNQIAESKGGRTGGQVGATAGSYFGPIGTVVGAVLGTIAGEAFDDPDARRTAKFQNLKPGDADNGWTLGESKLGKFGLRDEKWFSGAEMLKPLQAIGKSIAATDDAVLSRLNLSEEQLAKARNELEHNGADYSFGMEHTGNWSPRFIVDRYATVLDQVDPKLGDVMRLYRGGFENLDKFIGQVVSVAEQKKAGTIGDAEIDELRNRGIQEMFDGGYQIGYVRAPKNKREQGIEELPEVQLKINKGISSGYGGGEDQPWIQRLKYEYESSEAGQKRKNELLNQLPSLSGPAEPPPERYRK